MSRKRIAINGFGRIGRLVARTLFQHENLELVAVNDLAPLDNLAYLFQYDTVHGKLPGKDRVKAEGNALCIGSQRIEVTSEKDPAALPWKKLGIDYVVESTGRFTHLEDA